MAMAASDGPVTQPEVDAIRARAEAASQYGRSDATWDMRPTADGKGWECWAVGPTHRGLPSSAGAMADIEPDCRFFADARGDVLRMCEGWGAERARADEYADALCEARDFIAMDWHLRFTGETPPRVVARIDALLGAAPVQPTADPAEDESDGALGTARLAVGMLRARLDRAEARIAAVRAPLESMAATTCQCLDCLPRRLFAKRVLAILDGGGA